MVSVGYKWQQFDAPEGEHVVGGAMENQIAKKKLVHTMLVRVSSPLSVMSRNSSSLIIFSKKYKGQHACHTHTHTHTCIFIHAYKYIYIYVYVCMYVCIIKPPFFLCRWA